MVKINLTREDCDNRIFLMDGFSHTNIDYDGLNPHEILCLCVYSFSVCDMAVYRKKLQTTLGWTAYKIRKLRKEINDCNLTNWYIDCDFLVDEDTGLLCGKGYSIDFNLLNYKEWIR